VQATGNVAIRGLQVVAPSDLTNVTCQPSLGTILAAGAIMTCHGSHSVTQEELERQHNSYNVTLQADNLVMTNGAFRQWVEVAHLPVLTLPIAASLTVELNTQDCQRPSIARKQHLIQGLQQLRLLTNLFELCVRQLGNLLRSTLLEKNVAELNNL
jgi:hypothetical protein